MSERVKFHGPYEFDVKVGIVREGLGDGVSPQVGEVTICLGLFEVPPSAADIKAAIDKHMAPLLEQGIRPMTKREAWDNSELDGYALIGGDEWEPVDEERDTA